MPIQYLSNTSPTMPRVIAISGPIKPTGGGSCRISHWFPRCTGKRDQPAGFGLCRIACRYPSAEFGWCRWGGPKGESRKGGDGTSECYRWLAKCELMTKPGYGYGKCLTVAGTAT